MLFISNLVQLMRSYTTRMPFHNLSQAKNEEPYTIYHKLYAISTARSGQLLAEVLIAIAVGSILIIGSTIAMVSVVRTNNQNRQNQAGSAMAHDMLERIRALSVRDWNTLSSLSRGSNNAYAVAPGTSTASIFLGKEGVLLNDITAGLVGHWKFDELSGTTVYDFSGNQNNGVLGTTTRVSATSSCPVSFCASFNGTSSSLTVPDNTTLDISGQFTLAAWVRWDQFKNHGIIAQKGTGADANVMNYGIVSSVGNQITGSISTATTSNSVSYTSASILSTNTWHHIAFVADGSTLTLYVNGVSRATQQQLIQPRANANPFLISSPYSSYSFDGAIDDVRLYNRALNTNEINALAKNLVLMRMFFVDSVARDQCGSGNVTTTATTTCVTWNGIASDPSTLNITTQVLSNSSTFSIVVPTLITRTQNNSAIQKGWLEESIIGPVSDFELGFASSSNIALVGQSIRPLTSSTTGIVYSSILDTRGTLGVNFNTLWWHGTLPTNAHVRFQIASSNSSSTSGWNFIGPGGTSLITDYYEPSDSGKPTKINIQYHNNHRFFRYKLFLVPDSAGLGPIVNDAVINWSF